MVHIVQRGDTLYRIARQYNLTLGELRALNQLTSSSRLTVGQSLLVVKEESKAEIKIPKTYTVNRGDSLYSISQKLNIPLTNLRSWNKLSAEASIFPGQELQIISPEEEAIFEKNEFHTPKTYVVQRGDSLTKIAQLYNLSLNTLLELNQLSVQSAIFPGQTLLVFSDKPIEQRQPKSTYFNKESNKQETYTVKAGDSLYGIAVKHGVTANQLKEWNNLKSVRDIKPEQVLWLTQPKEADVENESLPKGNKQVKMMPQHYTVQSGDSLYGIANKYQLAVNDLLQYNQMGKQATIFPGQELIVGFVEKKVIPYNEIPLFHTVQHGETLFGIANHFGVSKEELLRLNGLSNDATLFPGQSLRVRPTTPPNSAANLKPTKHIKWHNLTTKYIVQKGDWLSKIARKHKVPVKTLVEFNDLNSTNLREGQALYIPRPEQPDIPRRLRKQAKRIMKVRADYALDYRNGEALLQKGIRGAVGKVERMYPEDVEIIQNRLAQLGILAENHTENPYEIQKRLGRRPLWYEAIPNTMTAIQQFQETYRVAFWAEEETRHNNLGNVPFTSLVIKPNDLTYRILEEYTIFTLQIPHPYKKKEKIEAQFNNFYVSRHTVDYRGVSFIGSANPDIPLRLFTDLGLDETLAKAVKYVSAHEGNFDAINSYDKAIFSYGFIQFAGARGGLGAVMALMKAREPKLFETYFQECGIDVAPIYSGSKIVGGRLKIFDLYTTDGNFEKVGEEAEKALRHDIQLYGPFIRAGHRLEFIACQIESAVEGYIKPALKIKIDVEVGNMKLENVPLTDIICSPMGLGLIIDLTVNQWINRTREVFQAAIETVATEDLLDTPALLKNINEVKVIESIVNEAGALDDRIAKRGMNFLLSSLSPVKGNVDSNAFFA